MVSGRERDSRLMPSGSAGGIVSVESVEGEGLAAPCSREPPGGGLPRPGGGLPARRTVGEEERRLRMRASASLFVCTKISLKTISMVVPATQLDDSMPRSTCGG